MNIGWIGLGHMGVPMAGNVLRAGAPLAVYNRTQQKAQPLIDQGAAYCASPRELAERSDIIFTMLSDGAAVDGVLEGENGLLRGIGPGQIVVDMSTVSPGESRSFAERIEARGARFLDAPVSGSVKPAQEAKLVILVGGRAEDLEVVRPYFEWMGKAVIRFGDHGSGSYAKLVINSLLAITVHGVSEALLLADACGLDREQVLQMISESAVGTPLIRGKQEHFMKEQFPAAFMLKLMSKDLGLALDAAQQRELQLPLIEAAGQSYRQALRNGKGELDLTAVFKELQERNGR